jgi:Carboxypeptidase regulatory-like domain
MKVETLTPVVAAAPGARAHWRLRVENDGTRPLAYRLDVVGFDAAYVVPPPPTPPLAPGASEEVDLELLIPEAFAAGQHSIAVQVVPDQGGVAPVIATVSVTVGTVDDIAMAVVPSTIRAHRRGRFNVDIDNRSHRTVDLELVGEGPELQVRMRPERVVLRPGERVRTSGRVKGPRHVFGERVQHSLSVAARSRSAPVYAPATFQQRPTIAHGLRSMVAILLIVGIWAGALVAGYQFWNSRQKTAAPAVDQVDTDGDGQPDHAANDMIDTDGDGKPDTVAAEVAKQVEANGGPLTAPQPGGSEQKTRAVVGGTVQSGDSGDPAGVDVTLQPVDLGAASPGGAQALAFGDSGDGGAEKVWPARFALYSPVIRSAVRRTQSVATTTTTNDKGAWMFPVVAVGRSYELSFSRPGYDTQAFIVTPTGDGKPLELPVELKPAKGGVVGTVSGPGGGLGNVQLVLTDGTLTFNSATASGKGAGGFVFTGVSTPGTYTLSATGGGLGTEVVQVSLQPGETKPVNIRMHVGVGSISGHVTEDGGPLGGVSLTASNGDTTLETTSLTEGDRGSYNFPELAIPGRYTITASREGYVTQTKLVDLTANARGIDFDFKKATGAITGLVESSSTGAGLPGANVHVTKDKLSFDTQTAAQGDPGAFDLRDVPPGTYLIEFSAADHEKQSAQVTVVAGRVTDLGTITLLFQPTPPTVQSGSLEVRVVDSTGAPLVDAKSPTVVRLARLADNSTVATQSGASQSSFTFEKLAIGTYTIVVTKENYRQSTARVSIGTGPAVQPVVLFKLGQVSGRLVDSATKAELKDYLVELILQNPNGTETVAQRIPVDADAQPQPDADGNLQVRFSTDALVSGEYRVNFARATPGYTVTPDQVLQADHPPMRFTVSPTDDRPIDLGDILADRLPEIWGVTQSPQFNDTTTPPTTTFIPIDDPTLKATLTCPAAGGKTADFVIPNPDPKVVSKVFDNGIGSVTQPETFYFDPVDLWRNNMVGPCKLTVQANGYVPTTTNVNVQARRGVHSRLDDNVALFRPNQIGGHVYWLDRGAPSNDPRQGHVDASGVSVKLQGDVTTGFDPGNVPFGSTGANPRPRNGPVPALLFTDGNGNWAYPVAAAAPLPPGPTTTVPPVQVFGAGIYLFQSRPLYADASIVMTVNQGVRTATAGSPPPLAVSAGGDVQLDAAGGTITANVDVITVKGTAGWPGAPNLGQLTAHLTGAHEAAGELSSPTRAGNVIHTKVPFVTDDPGTYHVTVGLDAGATSGGRPLFLPLVPGFDDAAKDVKQQPGESPLPVTMTWVEAGSVDVQVVDLKGAPITDVHTTVTGGGTAIPITTTAQDNIADGLPVVGGGSTPYTISVTDPGKVDMSTAQMTVFDGNGNTIKSACFLSEPTCSPAFNVLPGSRPVVRIRIARYGTITGTITGVNLATDTTSTPLPITTPPTPGLRLSAKRIAFSTGNLLCVTDPSLDKEPAIEAVADGNRYVVQGPPGYYVLTPTHPEYADTIPNARPPQTTRDQCLIGIFPTFIDSSFQITNNEDNPLPAWRLQKKPSPVTVHVVNDSLTATGDGVGADVPGATVVMTLFGGTPPGQTAPSGTTGPDGIATIDGVLSGSYHVKVTKTNDAGQQQYFSLSFDVSIPTGGDDVTMNVPLVRIGGTINGDVRAENTVQEAVAPPAAVTISDAYDAPDPTVTGATIVGITPADAVAPVDAEDPPAGSAPETPRTYTFSGLGSGQHVLSFEDVGAAYTTPTSKQVVITGPVPQRATDAIYTAQNRDVIITAPPGAKVQLVEPTGTKMPPGWNPAAIPCTGTPCVATFAGVPPKLAQYTVNVTKDLFAPASPKLTVAPDVGPVSLTVNLTPSTARINGTVQTRSGPVGAPGSADANATGTVDVFLVGQPGPRLAQVPINGGTYSYDATRAGTYRFVPSVDATHAPRERTVTISNAQLGTVVDGGAIVLPKLARFVLTVGPAEANATLAITTTFGPPTIPPAQVTSDTGFEVTVDPGGGDGSNVPVNPPRYAFTLTSATGYAQATVPAQTIDIGATTPVSVTLDPRAISGSVTGSSSATVRILRGDANGNPTGDPIGAAVPNAGSFTFPGPFAAGRYVIVAELLGTGRNTHVVDVANTDGQETDQDVPRLAARPVDVSFTSTPSGATFDIEPTKGQKPADVTTPGTATLDEDQFAITYSVSLTGYVTQNDISLDLTSLSNTWNQTRLTLSAPSVTLQPVPPPPTNSTPDDSTPSSGP